MILINPNSPHDAILEFVKNWMRLLAEHRTDDACALIDEPNSYGIEWTSVRIWQIVNERFLQTHGSTLFTPKDQSLAIRLRSMRKARQK